MQSTTEEINGEEWSDRQCGLPTQKEVPGDHPGEAEERKKNDVCNFNKLNVIIGIGMHILNITIDKIVFRVLHFVLLSALCVY